MSMVRIACLTLRLRVRRWSLLISLVSLPMLKLKFDSLKGWFIGKHRPQILSSWVKLCIASQTLRTQGGAEISTCIQSLFIGSWRVYWGKFSRRSMTIEMKSSLFSMIYEPTNGECKTISITFMPTWHTWRSTYSASSSFQYPQALDWRTCFCNII